MLSADSAASAECVERAVSADRMPSFGSADGLGGVGTVVGEVVSAAGVAMDTGVCV